MKAPLRLEHRTREQRARIRDIKRRFHIRAFGEELARVNLDMTEAERRKYLAWMRETARRRGVPLERSGAAGWMDRLEDESGS
jgi:hypothetical protein